MGTLLALVVGAALGECAGWGGAAGGGRHSRAVARRRGARAGPGTAGRGPPPAHSRAGLSALPKL